MENLSEIENYLLSLFKNRKYPKDSKRGYLDYLLSIEPFEIDIVQFFEKFYETEFVTIGKLSNYLRFVYFARFNAKEEFYAVIKEAIVSKYPKLESMLQH